MMLLFLDQGGNVTLSRHVILCIRRGNYLMGKSVIEVLFTSSHILKKEKDGRLQWQSQNM